MGTGMRFEAKSTSILLLTFYVCCFSFAWPYVKPNSMSFEGSLPAWPEEDLHCFANDLIGSASRFLGVSHACGQSLPVIFSRSPCRRLVSIGSCFLHAFQATWPCEPWLRVPQSYELAHPFASGKRSLLINPKPLLLPLARKLQPLPPRPLGLLVDLWLPAEEGTTFPPLKTSHLRSRSSVSVPLLQSQLAVLELQPRREKISSIGRRKTCL